MDRTYNGWTNYATWRVHLEMFDGVDPRDWGYRTTDPDEVLHWVKDYAESAIEDTSSPGLARDYALAFISDVNWREIAQHLIDAYADETEEAA